jgi:RNA polymerase sigma-70 factor (ECF subfamily)
MSHEESGAGPTPGHVTQLLHQARSGDPDALERLVPLVYAELRRQAARQLHQEAGPRPLQPTELVHEAYLQLTDNRRIQWQDRAHFFAVSATLMRRILVDQARARQAQKRGGDVTHLTLSHAEDETEQRADLVDLLMLDDTLKRLSVLDPRQVQVVELRVFAGLSVEEIATALDVSPRTIKSDWQMARAWLSRELRDASST